MESGNAVLAALGWFGLGLSAGLLTLILASRGALSVLSKLNVWVHRGTVAGIALLSVAVLSVNHKTSTSDDVAQVTDNGPQASAMASNPGTGGSMDAATVALATRLAATGGTDADWDLLAQSYDFLGRTDDAKLAREHKVSPQRSLQDAITATSRLRPSAGAPGLMPQAAAPVGKVSALLEQAEEHRRKREFKQACDVYRKVIATGGMTADAWADYADALASSAPDGALAGEPAKAVDQALAMDPNHTKALWLKASLAHEERRYQDAAATWRRLLVLVPSGSSDARIVQANLAEAERLAGKKG